MFNPFFSCRPLCMLYDGTSDTNSKIVFKKFSSVCYLNLDCHETIVESNLN